MRTRQDKVRLTIYLSKEACEQLDSLSRHITAKLGRKQGRGDSGRRSSTVEAAILGASQESVLSIVATDQAA